ncbi:MAG: ATP-dependent sacrificial sulfur transferase LarE [Planctomycetota bacterium]
MDQLDQIHFENKLHHLTEWLQQKAPVAVAFSGGVDSGYLSLIAHRTLKEKGIAVTANSETFPPQELEICQRVANEIGIKHHLITTKELEIKGFRANQVSRCYFCKQELYEKIRIYLKETPEYTLVDGSIADDAFELRPGMQAAQDLGVWSPLRIAGLTKSEIRTHAKALGLSIWDKPALACLSSRIPYGTEVTFDRLIKVREAEAFLKELGWNQFRVRAYEAIAKLEIPLEAFARYFSQENRLRQRFEEIGFTSLVLDLKGFRSGSMHEAFQMIPEAQREARAKQLWEETKLPGHIQQLAQLTLIQTSEPQRILDIREKLVDTFHRSGLPYLVLDGESVTIEERKI